MNVRRVRAEEWPAVRALRIAAVTETPLSFAERLVEVERRPDERWRARVAAMASSDGETLVVAEGDAGALVGMAGGRLDASEAGLFRLHYSYVVPPCRGLGLSRALTVGVADFGRGIPGVEALTLYVHVGNERALGAYARLGFVDTGVVARHPVHHTESEHVLRLPL